MRAIIQRVTQAEVRIDTQTISSINSGLTVLVGICEEDTEEDVRYIADKLIGLRIFTDLDGKMNLSISQVDGEILLVSQFTLCGDARKGRRPSFSMAARPETAIPLYEKLIDKIKEYGIPIKTGVFGADMQIKLTNDGPVTIMLDSKKLF